VLAPCCVAELSRTKSRRRLRRRWPGVSGGLCPEGPPAARRAKRKARQIRSVRTVVSR
jgi:hypothetical protein